MDIRLLVFIKIENKQNKKKNKKNKKNGENSERVYHFG